jgi:hypothetical protein
VFYQHTPATAFPLLAPESIANPWGEGPSDNAIVDQSAAPIQWHSLTNVVDPVLGPIGHTQVPDWYQTYVVNEGKALTS